MKLDILKQIFSPSLEEIATGVAAPEKEHVIYGRMVDMQQLSRASHMEKQEQWEIKVPKTDDNASRGTVRARRTEVEGQPVEYTACVKTPMGDQSNPIARNEVVVPCTEDFFEVLKKLAGSGMIKHRYFFPITAGISGTTDVAAVQATELSENVPGVITDEVPDEAVNANPESSGATPEETALDGDVSGEVVSTESDDDLSTKIGQPFMKRAVQIHAIKWTGKNIAEVQAFMNDGDELPYTEISNDDGDIETDGELYIGTLEDGKEKDAKHVASPGDWIICGVQGEFYPCKPDIFIQTYAPVSAVSLEDESTEDAPDFNDGVAIELTPVAEDGAGEAIVQEQPTGLNPGDQNPLQSPEAGGQQYWEVDVFIKADGTYYDYVKIDLEVSDLNAPLPPLPVQLAEMVTAPYGQRTPEEETMVTNLYDTVFRTRNPGAVPITPTPEFEQTALVEDGTPAEGTPADSNGIKGDQGQPLPEDPVTTDEVETPAQPFQDGVATSITEVNEDDSTEIIPTEPGTGDTEAKEVADQEATDLPTT